MLRNVRGRRDSWLYRITLGPASLPFPHRLGSSPGVSTIQTCSPVPGPTTQSAPTQSNGGGTFPNGGVLATADNAIATGDYVVVEMPDGTTITRTVTMSSLSATLASNLPMAIPAGMRVWSTSRTRHTPTMVRVFSLNSKPPSITSVPVAPIKW